jgi:Rnl2 family RNA ligase
MWYDGVEFRSAKRSCLIADDENFSVSRKVVTENKDKGIAIYNDLKLVPGTDVMAIFGEIFGGNYPHKDVEKVKNATQVQKGIFYSPDNLFYAFDIRVNETYLNYDKVIELFEKHGLFYAKILVRGTLKECMEYSNEFKSKIPEWLGLPEIEGENITEGTVLKPIDSKFFGCGSRVILKNKNDKWKEKASESKHPKPPKEEIKLSDEGNRLMTELDTYVCENRLKNVLSKIGTVTQKDFGKILGAMAVDTLKDFKKDHEDAFNALPEDDQKAINKRTSTVCQLLIRKHIVDIVDGNF